MALFVLSRRCEAAEHRLILADAYGIDGMGCYGSERFKGRTPHLDALAQSGLRLTSAPATPAAK